MMYSALHRRTLSLAKAPRLMCWCGVLRGEERRRGGGEKREEGRREGEKKSGETGENEVSEER